MEVETKHPDYLDREAEWALMRHAIRGASAIQQEGTRYLPMPSGFQAQPDGGAAMYGAYKKRARFLDVLAPILRGMVGLIHRTEAQVTLPERMMPLWEKATGDGLPLEAFHRRITFELLLMGRYSVLTDAPAGGGDLPFFAGYTAETLINWSKTQDFYVLDETHLARTKFKWEEEKQHRELVLQDGRYTQNVYGRDGEKKNDTQPSGRSGNLEEIPLVVINPQDLSTNLIEPPLIGVARAAIAAYQLDADYRHQLYMSGQETLFLIGTDETPKNVGAAVVHALPEGADAKYVGPSCKGIDAHRQAIMDAKEEAISAGIKMFDQQSGQESGEALRLRYGAQTSSLTTVAQTSSQALERSLRYAAMFLGLDPNQVVVKPNLRFVDTVMTPEAARKLMELWMGRAISKQTLFENLQRGEIVSEERDFEEEEGLIESEAMDPPVPGGGNPPPPQEEEAEEEEEEEEAEA